MRVCPLIFDPIFKPKIWGGRRLAEVVNKRLPEGIAIGESWEIADLEGDQSRVRSGPARDRTLHALVDEWGPDLLGRAAPVDGRFPLLIKYLDASQPLSVQVHPTAEVARSAGRSVRVKNEAWYVIHAEPDGTVFRGLHPDVDRAAFARAVDDGHVASTLRRVRVRPGDCHYLPSGTVHALGAGVVVAEIQTPSDTTYRVYDWDRVDPATGQARRLHIAEALRCIDFADAGADPQPRAHVAGVWTTTTRLITCDHFVVERVRMFDGIDHEIPYAEPVIWMVLEGSGRISYAGGDPVSFAVGDTVLLPAALQDGRVHTTASCLWLEITLPAPSDLADLSPQDRAALRADARTHEPYVSVNVDRKAGDKSADPRTTH